MTRAGAVRADLTLGRVLVLVRRGIMRREQYLRGGQAEREQ